MRRGVCLSGLFAVAVGAAGAADRPLQPDPEPVVFEQLVYSGSVAAIDERTLAIRGYDGHIGFPGGRPRCKTAPTADGKGTVTTGSHVAYFYDGGPMCQVARAVELVRSEQTPDAWILTPAGGEPVVLKLADQPVRRFVVRGPLAEGEYDPTQMAGSTYRLADIRVGDRVSIKGVRGFGVEFVEVVSIKRRPGASVPPAPGDLKRPPPLNQPWYHEMMDAMQAFEEKGTPLPEGFHEFKRWVHPAPPPREVPPKL